MNAFYCRVGGGWLRVEGRGLFEGQTSASTVLVLQYSVYSDEILGEK